MKKMKENNANVCVKATKQGKNKNRFVSLVCLALLTVIMLCGCTAKNGGTQIDENGKKLVRIAYFPNVTHAQGIIMKEQGILEEALGDGYSVSWIPFNAGPAEVEALFAGEIDLGYIGPVPAISANVTSNGEFKILAGGAQGGEALVARTELDLTDLNALKGKKVAVPQKGNTQHLSLLALLENAGLTVGTGEEQVEVVEAENADILNLLSQKAIDAAMIPEPWVSVISAEEEVQVARDYNEIWQETGNVTSVVVGNVEYLDNNKEVYEAFLKAHEQVTAYIQENQTEAMAIVQQQLLEIANKEIATDVLEQAFARLTFAVTTEGKEQHIYDFGKLSFNEGFIKQEPTDLFYGVSQ